MRIETSRLMFRPIKPADWQNFFCKNNLFINAHSRLTNFVQFVVDQIF